MNQLDRIETKLDEHTEALAEIKVDLKYHIKRTDLLEQKVELVKTLVSIGKALLWIGAASAALTSILKLWQHLSSQ